MDCSKFVFTIPEVARYLRISRNSAYAAAKRNQIPTVQIGRRLLVPAAALESLMTCQLDQQTTLSSQKGGKSK